MRDSTLASRAVWYALAMVDCERCGAPSIDLPCPPCGWQGEAVEQPVKRPGRSVPLLVLAVVLVVAGSLLVVLGLGHGALARLPGLLAVAAGFRVLVWSRRDG